MHIIDASYDKLDSIWPGDVETLAESKDNLDLIMEGITRTKAVF